MTKSAEYKAWLSTAMWEIKTQHLMPIGTAEVQIAIYAPANGRRDLDNHCKPLLDLLVNLKLIDGDRFKTVKKITMEWHDQPAMLIQIESMSPSLTTFAESRTPRRARSASGASGSRTS